ncbi:hypothetical protein L596_007211 [Steinernema carpocapsae]|uniref:TFIID subunit TAF5 NTD2 domain-containing protein n=1 Tax=Steinernema carpocapsae TaxID=34508 RepID=A0A4U5P9L7_STECR|nr:hypothetical protein L596_007211 [Steinernema carpocapsae]
MMSGELDSLNQENIQKVLDFLKRNGLTDAEQALSREAENILRAESDLQQNSEEQSNEALSREFDALYSHIMASFDCHRTELSAFLFPVFAHIYTRALMEGHNTFAASFYHQFKKVIPSWHEEPVQKLGLLTNQSQAIGNEIVEALTNNSFLIKISKVSMKSFETFLLRHPLIKAIIKEKIVIESLDSAVRSKPSLEANMGGLLGQASKSEKKYKVFYGLIKEDLTSQFDKKKPKGKDGKESKKKDTNAPLIDRIPLPTLTESMKAEKRQTQKDLLKKTKINADSPPNICMFTVSNAGGGVTAVDVTEDSSLIGLGYGDSVIQVNVTGDSSLYPLKPIEELEALDPESDEMATEIYDKTQDVKNIKLQGHQGTVYSLSFSPDRRLLLSSSLDSTVRLWSIGTRKNVVVYRTNSPIWQVQFSPRSYYFATAGSDSTAMVWATDRMQPLRIFTGALSDVSCIDYHPNCNYIVGGSEDRYVRLYDVLSGSCVRTFSGHKGAVRGIKVSPCGRYIVSVSEEGSLIVWDIALQRMVTYQDTDPFPSMTALCFSRDGGTIAVSTPQSAISLYSLEALLASNSGQDHTSNEVKVNYPSFSLYSYPTKNTPVLGLHFTRKNILLGIGAFGQ